MRFVQASHDSASARRRASSAFSAAARTPLLYNRFRDLVPMAEITGGRGPAASRYGWL